jgi:hypothetical protein
LCSASLLVPQDELFVAEPRATKPSIDFTAGVQSFFLKAKPVWPKGREIEMNLFVGFRTIFESPNEGPVTLRAAGSTLYRFFVNGDFRGFGPARGLHGYFRVDEWDITPALPAGPNIVAIEVAGYNVNRYYILNQTSFEQRLLSCGMKPRLRVL